MWIILYEPNVYMAKWTVCPGLSSIIYSGDWPMAMLPMWDNKTTKTEQTSKGREGFSVLSWTAGRLSFATSRCGVDKPARLIIRCYFGSASQSVFVKHSETAVLLVLFGPQELAGLATFNRAVKLYPPQTGFGCDKSKSNQLLHTVFIVNLLYCQNCGYCHVTSIVVVVFVFRLPLTLSLS